MVELVLGWLWQGTALALLVTAGLRLGPSTSAPTRYAIWWACLVAVLIMPVAWLRLAPVVGVGPTLSSAAEPTPWTTGLWVAVASLWIGGFVLQASRIGRALYLLRRTKRTCQPLGGYRELDLRRWYAVTARGRSARLCVSSELAVASVLGYWRPVIAIPDTLATALTGEELDHVFLHELGHVQRRDDWAKLAQSVLEALACVHPAVWWIGASLNLERELACDDWVVRRGGSPRAYASCLTKIAELTAPRVDVAVAPGVAGPSTPLTYRVERLLRSSRDPHDRACWTAVGGGCGIVAASVLSMAPLAPAVMVGAGQPPPLVSSPPVGLADQIASVPIGRPVRPPLDARAPVEALETTGRPALSIARAVPGEPLTIAGVPLALPPTAVQLRRGRTERLESTPIRLTAGLATGRPVAVARPLTLRVDRVEDGDNPWVRMADAGKAIGSGARKAGLATAGFFTRLGGSISGAFAAPKASVR